MFNSILPPNATRTEQALEAAIRKTAPDLTPIAQLMRPETCPAHLLGWLAWAFSVDDWDASWPEAVQRRVLRDTLFTHRHKGTLGAVRRALKAAGYGDARIIERYGDNTHDGARFYDGAITYAPTDHWAEYRVVLTRPITIAQATQIRAILANIAPARCHLRAFTYQEAQNLYDGKITHDGTFTHGVV